jgi:chromosome segregation ATPase
VEQAERELNSYTVRLNKLAQEKLYLVEQQKNLNQDSPFAEEYRNESMSLKAKQGTVQQLKAELERVENEINATRTQVEVRKHELEVSRSDESELMRENARLEELVALKRSTVTGVPPPVGVASLIRQSESTSSALSSSARNQATGVASTAAAAAPVKTSQSTSNVRSNTPKGMWLLFIMKMKEEIRSLVYLLY